MQSHSWSKAQEDVKEASEPTTRIVLRIAQCIERSIAILNPHDDAIRVSVDPVGSARCGIVFNLGGRM